MNRRYDGDTGDRRMSFSDGLGQGPIRMTMDAYGHLFPRGG